VTFRIGQNVRAIEPPVFRGCPLVITGEPRPLGSVPPDSTYYGLSPDMIVQPVDAPCYPAKPGYFCAWPVAWLEADDGNAPVAWTEGLRNVCGVHEEESVT
jgi:hypothetical protein